MIYLKTDDPKTSVIVELDDLRVINRYYENILSPLSNLANTIIYEIEPIMIKEYFPMNPSPSDIGAEKII